MWQYSGWEPLRIYSGCVRTPSPSMIFRRLRVVRHGSSSNRGPGLTLLPQSQMPSGFTPVKLTGNTQDMNIDPNFGLRTFFKLTRYLPLWHFINTEWVSTKKNKSGAVEILIGALHRTLRIDLEVRAEYGAHSKCILWKTYIESQIFLDMLSSPYGTGYTNFSLDWKSRASSYLYLWVRFVGLFTSSARIIPGKSWI